MGQLQICQAVHPAVTELLGRASHLRMQDPSSFGLGSWHLQEKLLSPPVLTLPHWEPFHSHHFTDTGRASIWTNLRRAPSAKHGSGNLPVGTGPGTVSAPKPVISQSLHLQFSKHSYMSQGLPPPASFPAFFPQSTATPAEGLAQAKFHWAGLFFQLTFLLEHNKYTHKCLQHFDVSPHE